MVVELEPCPVSRTSPAAERDTSTDKTDDVSHETQPNHWQSQLGDGHLEVGIDQQMTAVGHSYLLLTSSTNILNWWDS